MTKKHYTIYAILTALLILGAVHAAGVPIVRLGVAAVVTSAPSGIVNPNDIYNGWYPDAGPQAFADPKFIDRVDWLLEEQTGATISWGALQLANPEQGGPSHTPTFAVVHCGIQDVTLDSRAIAKSTEAARVAILQGCGAPQSGITLKWYPGYSVRHPVTTIPVCAAWPDHPWARGGRKMFRPCDGDNLTSYPIGSIFETTDAKYQKVYSITSPGAGPFGSGGKSEPAWEKVYTR